MVAKIKNKNSEDIETLLKNNINRYILIIKNGSAILKKLQCFTYIKV